MAAGTFHHFGVPTSEAHEDETYIESAGVHVTDPEEHPFRIEFLRFDADCAMPELLKTRPHAAFKVDDLEAALAGRTVVVEPFDATECLRCAFIMDGDALIELMQEIEKLASKDATMKKFINDPEKITQELLEGFALAHEKKVELTSEGLVVRRESKPKDRVALVTLGGSGHEPALSGFVGPGMLDVSVPGEIFAAPGPPRVLEALRHAHRDAGVLFVVLNHEGDVMSSKVAMQMAEQEKLKVHAVITHEDISAGTREDPAERRGLVGCLLVYKVAGAAAEQGRSLEDCVAIAERMEQNMATLAVATSAATHPCTGDAISEVPDGQMVVGMGQHGEAGGGAQQLESADHTAEIMLDALLKDLDVGSGEKVLVLLNGVGSTTLMELYVVHRRVGQLLAERGIELARSLVGSYLSVQEMGGFQVCLARMDDELLALWDAPCDTPALTVVR